MRSPTDETKVTGTIILGRVKLFHVRTDTITERGSIDVGRLLPVSRLGGISYGRTTQAYGKVVVSSTSRMVLMSRCTRLSRDPATET